jgi:hypothetical protein
VPRGAGRRFNSHVLGGEERGRSRSRQVREHARYSSHDRDAEAEPVRPRSAIIVPIIGVGALSLRASAARSGKMRAAGQAPGSRHERGSGPFFYSPPHDTPTLPQCTRSNGHVVRLAAADRRSAVQARTLNPMSCRAHGSDRTDTHTGFYTRDGIRTGGTAGAGPLTRLHAKTRR